MKKAISILALAISTSANALSVSGYEELKKDNALAARTTILGYFAGLADGYNAQAIGGHPLVFSGQKLVCLPPGVTLSGPILKALVDQELQKSVPFFRETLGQDWRSFILPSVLLYALPKNYPCP